ncbi:MULTISPECIES: FAD-binding oxidoreductase [Pseudonocardia]|uniref:6-hydroxy-D-nicotine oxidase n=2 Tax=Pseudonocardia TaxID=1847 RepID=A0A1Y2MIY7_PSEAH|nr:MULTISPECIES: FAD-dependent oxidoreductase [Pseudonocardia]OSY35223.1 6-hydroxy-D-nicotine oxidase [Pseudonocardia autotrophica]TDN73173.1 FAD/FMN-containing dehydrogenase [Pseudonocardia autotrophica]BBG03900.1 6-hydroxy-D-nicotine oxidase [Pseudonocardia autotrophica]GEC28281.1 6-hydroxy-D-nicotine oxidase [Pseudonocardia saturnea]
MTSTDPPATGPPLGAPDLVAALRSTVPTGSVHTAGPEFTRATTLFNSAAETTPHVVVRCVSTADVQAAVRAAREHDVAISVRSGGHDFWGRGIRAGGLVLDLTGMRTVHIDAEARHAVVGGGALSSDVVSAAERVGLTAVTGTSGAVGMVGLTLGGGYGPLIGRFGLAADNLLGADVVLADGSLVRADAEHHPDLFWALRGGGGNFGVVTSARIQLHPVPTVVSGTILYPATRTRRLLSDLGEILHEGPDELSVDIGFLPGPAGDPVVYLAPTWSGDIGRGDADDGPVRALARLATPMTAEIGPVARSTTLAATDAMFPVGRRGAIRTRTVRDISEPVGARLEHGAATFTSGFSAVLAHDFHGAATRRDLDTTAFGIRRPHRMIEVIAMWENDGRGDTPHLDWADTVHEALAPHSLPGGYVNFLGPDHPDQIAEAYGTNTRPLLSIKSKLDPDSVFTATPLPERTNAPAR